MSSPQTEGWLTRGSFLQRLGKESLIVGPVAFLCCFYAIARYRIDIPTIGLVAIAALITVAASAYFATRPVSPKRGLPVSEVAEPLDREVGKEVL
ncbi:MAG TPA: hypothetical protein VGN16_24425 [Acidobacteriaceae bacterium]